MQVLPWLKNIVSFRKKRRTDSSVPKELELNSGDYLRLMKLAFDHQIYPQVAHMGHIALELAIKAAYAKRFKGIHPWGHRLNEICDYEFDTNLKTTFYDEVAMNESILRRFRTVRAAWKMQNRYLRRNVGKKTADMHKQCFGEVTQWILQNYVR